MGRFQGQEFTGARNSAAAESLKQSSSSRSEILLNGVAEGSDPMDILPKVGLTNHVYQLYLFRVLGEAGAGERGAILNEMDSAEDHLNELGVLHVLHSDLTEAGFKYLDGYLR